MRGSALFNEKQIKQRIRKLASKINTEITDDELYVLIVLNGAFIFAADLIRLLSKRVYVDFCKIKSYYNNQQTNQLNIILRPQFNYENKTVLIIDDIYDTGNTLNTVKSLIQEQRPKRIYTCVLLTKDIQQVDFYAFYLTSDCYVVGYGLDNNECERNLPYIYCLQ